MKDIIFIIICAGGLLVPSALAKLWWLFFVFVEFFICFGITETICYFKTGNTISQHFVNYSVIHPKFAWGILGCMLISWLSLIWHFAQYLLRKI